MLHLQGVTYRLTQGVVKNIIPAVASTNAIIAATCANEVFKLATGCAPQLKNYMFVNGTVCGCCCLLCVFTWGARSCILSP